MSSFYPNSQPKVRQEGFDSIQHHPPSPSATPASPGQFDANMFFGHHLFNGSTNPAAAQQVDHHIPHSYKPDFADDLASMMGDVNRPPSPHHAVPHNPFDTNSTVPYHQRAAPPPHNIFDVSSPTSFPAHFSLPSQSTHHPSHSHSHSQTHFDTSYDYRTTSRSRSRSKVPGPPETSTNNGGRVSRSKRGSVSGTSPRPHSPHTRPQAILIPPNVNGHHGAHHPVSPLSMHMHAQTAPSAWFIDSSFGRGDSFRTTDSPFSLPTPDSINVHHPFNGPGSLPTNTGSPKSVSAKESPPPSGQLNDAAAKQAQLASEKRRRRRESHNAVERRRRDNINEKISELATLIPECMLDPNAGADPSDPFLADDTKDSSTPLTPNPSTSAPGASAASAGPVKANKGMILRKSVEYIRYLQQLVNAQATRNRELEAQLSGGAVGMSLSGGLDGLGGEGRVPSLTHTGLTDSESPGSLKVVDEVDAEEDDTQDGQDGDGQDGDGDYMDEDGFDEERGRKRERIGGASGEKVRVKREVEEGGRMEE